MNTENNNIKEPSPSSKAKKNKINKPLMLLMIFVFLLLTAGAGIFSFVISDKAFSDSENRVLAQFPETSLSSLTDGSFMDNFENWLADQFPLRDDAISLKTQFDRIMGKRCENGVYIGEKGFLFDSQTSFDEKSVKEKTELINAFLSKHQDKEQMFMLIPNSSYIYGEYLPDGVEAHNQKAQTDFIYSSLTSEKLLKSDAVDVLSKAKEKGSLLYYKTDHHWTTDAAHEMYLQLKKGWKLNTPDVEYAFHTVADDFEGTLASKSGVHDSKDIIKICLPENSEGTYVVNFESEQRKEVSLFAREKLEEKNKYEVFLGGNYGKVSIKTTAQNDNVLLIIKDSYANCMIPMLTPHFSEIVILDPRYMTESIDTVIQEHSFTHILFLYNMNTFLEDTSLEDILSQ